VYPEKVLLMPAIILTGFISLFHLGKKLGSWRSVANLSRSPISREIAAFIIFSILSVLTIYVKVPGLLVASSLTGLAFLISIDGVYVFTDRSRLVILHSGQTFISSLLVISFFSGLIFPFIFIAILKIGLSIRNMYLNKSAGFYYGIRFLRLSFLFISGVSLVSHVSYPDIPVIVLFLLGELMDRILFYIDFNPVNISTMIEEQLNIDTDEKKRS
jgi:DMSO reductase anchor subunit